jgi:hypothetical protein
MYMFRVAGKLTWVIVSESIRIHYGYIFFSRELLLYFLWGTWMVCGENENGSRRRVEPLEQKTWKRFDNIRV